MKFDNNIPIYIQIVNRIKEKIARNELKKGTQLLSIREYAVKLKVNSNTIRKAYNELENNDIIFKKRGIGTFVTENDQIINKTKEEMVLKLVNDYINGMRSIGYKDENILIEVKEGLYDNEGKELK